jgi:DNA anti-recombination protein RmuC
MTFETVSDWGLWFRNLILGAADLLREGWTPGIVSLVLMAAAILAAVLHWWRTWQRRRALRWAIRLVERAMDRASFVVELPRINRAFVQTRDSRRRWPGFLRPAEYRRPIAVAWGEYNETMVAPEQDQGGGGVMRNSLRPATFFDTEELGFGQGWWRILPGLFVSVGLLLTFLGLIAALTAIGGDEINDDSLRELLNAASAKFIMSLTGLACSIVLTVLFRIRADAIDRQVRRLGHALEKRLRFLSLEEIAANQLHVLRQQDTALRSLATEMVAELARPLREELPAAIATSIRTEIGPILERIGQSGEEGVGAMVASLSDRLSGDIGTALDTASARLTAAASQLDGLVQRIGEQQTAMHEALQRDVQQAATAAGASIAEASAGITAPLSEIAARLKASAAAQHQATADMERLSGAARTAAQAMADGAARIEQAAAALSAAADPIRVDLARMAQSASEMSQGVRDALATAVSHMNATATGTRDALQAATDILGSQRDGIHGALQGLAIALEELRGHGERLDQIDTMLGQAFETYRQQVETTMAGTADKVREIVAALTPALATLESVVQQAEAFTPQALAAHGGRPGAP